MSEFLVKGTRVSFRLRSGREIDVPERYGMIHCVSGNAWPRCVVLVGPFHRGVEIDAGEISLASKKYLREGYAPHLGSFEAPDVGGSCWREVGELEKIWYQRQGELDVYMKHSFKRRQLLVIPAETLLYRCRSWWKIQLPGTCIINERGFVSP